jgi:hypothetical protein
MILFLRDADNRAVEIICTHDLQGQKRATTGKLIFNRYGKQYFLSELWMQGEITGSQLTKTAQEEALLRELRSVRKREKVTIKVTEAKPD